MATSADYVGPARIVDSAGERHTVRARLDWIDDAGSWSGTLSAPLDWRALDGTQLELELPSNRWWDVPFVSHVEIDVVYGERAAVHGRASDVNFDQYSNRRPRPSGFTLKL
jgi:hypothetical protein